VTRPPCAWFAADRSALVDGSLDVSRRERLLAHLVHCTGCRTEVAELRRVRAALRAGPAGEAPEDLAQRLISIAGAEARLPLCGRAFRRPRPGSLPRRRRVRRVRAAVTLVVVGTLTAGSAAAGYAAAPPDTLAAVRDPAPQARAAFTAALAQLPLADDTLGAVLAARPADLAVPAPVVGPGEPTAGTPALTPPQARTVLARAVGSVDSVGYSGLQTLRAQAGSKALSATVRVQGVPGRGVATEVLGRSGQPLSRGLTPATSGARLVDDKLLSLLAGSYRLTGWSGAQVAGRSATLVEAARQGQRAARWWVDDATGLVLARQTFDPGGQELSAVAFTTIQVSQAAAVLEHPPAQLVASTMDTVLTLSHAPDLARQGWVCHDQLAGLALVRLRTDSASAAEALHLVYSDGLATVSVFEQRGRLVSPPAGSSWDTALGAHTAEGAARLATWQSGTAVLTVVTDGPPSLLAAAVRSLPHDAAPERTTMGRIREGWGKLLADTKG